MRILLFLAALATAAHADPPFFPRGTATNQAMGGINANFLDQTTVNHNRLTTTIAPPSCPAGQALTGAFYNNGYTFGGTCAAFVVVGQTTVTTSSPISGNGSSGSPVTLTGAVPTGLVDLSTVTSALAGKANTFTGISSSCAAGFYLSTGTWANGVTTGGGCVSVLNGTGGVSTGVVTNATMGGNGNSTAPLGVNFSTITTAFQAVGVSTNALAVSTGIFKVWQATESVNVASLNLSTQSLAGGSATTYLHIDGSNYMTGQLIVQSSATISGTSGLLVTSTITVGGYSGIPRMDTYANLKTQAASGTAWFAYATDLKQFVFYSGLSSIGDNGWFIP